MRSFVTIKSLRKLPNLQYYEGAQWLSGRVLDSRPRGRRFEPHRRHCIVVLEQDTLSSLTLVQPMKTCPCLTERLLMGRKESNQTNKHYYDCIKNDFSLYDKDQLRNEFNFFLYVHGIMNTSGLVQSK